VVVLDEHVVQITSAPAKIAGGHLETKPITIMELESGRVAQLGEHLLCKQGVTGSNPVTSTNFFSDCKTLTEFLASPTPRFSCTGVDPYSETVS
jgi:hypothetical protein